MAGYATARQNGWLSANDIRELEDMNPLPNGQGGDEYLVNGNMVSAAAQAVPKGTTSKILTTPEPETAKPPDNLPE